jgi:hypothetical protein
MSETVQDKPAIPLILAEWFQGNSAVHKSAVSRNAFFPRLGAESDIETLSPRFDARPAEQT